MPITEEQAVDLARQHSMPEVENLDFRGSYSAMTEPEKDDQARLVFLVQAAYKLGRNAGLEEARKATIPHNDVIAASRDIESLKDKTS